MTEYLGNLGFSWKTPLRICFTVGSSPNGTPVGLCNTCDKADLTAKACAGVALYGSKPRELQNSSHFLR